MNTVLWVFAAVVLIASVCVHVATIVPGIFVSFGAVWPLHLLCIATFGAMLYVHNRRYPAKKVSVREALRITTSDPRAVFLKAVAGAKPWQVALVVVSFVYTVVNFVLVFSQTSDGQPTRIASDEYALTARGTVVREISADEFVRRERLTVRGFSGHWVFFSLLPFLYFGAIRTNDAG